MTKEIKGNVNETVEAPKKKRGRPSKAEIEARKQAAELDAIKVAEESKPSKESTIVEAMVTELEAEQKAEPKAEATQLDMESILAGFDSVRAEIKEVEGQTKGQRLEDAVQNLDGVTLEERFNAEGLRVLYDGKGESYENIYYSLLPYLDILKADKFKDHSSAYKALRKEIKGYSPAQWKRYLDASKGEIILIGKDRGKTALFIKPDSELVLPSKDGGAMKLTQDNWADKPLMVFTNGGRATKVGHYLGMRFNLRGDYRERTATQKYQEDRFVNRHWIVLCDNWEDEMCVRTRTGNMYPIQNIDLSEGWGTLLNEIQNRAI